MAGPVFNSVGTRVASAGAASLVLSKPSAAAASGFMLAIATSSNNETHSCATSGWSLVGQVNSGASFTTSLWRAKGDAVAPTVSWTSSVACSSQIAYYDDPSNVVDTVLGATTNNNGTANPHSTSAITTTRDSSLAVYIDACASNTALATPSGWTENSDAGGTSSRLVFGSKSVATSGSSSGAISVSGGAAAWVQWQVEVMGELPDANTIALSKVEVGAWEEPGAGASFSEVEVGAWLDVATPRRRQVLMGSF